MQRKQAAIRGLRSREGKWHYRFELNGHEYTGNTHLPATSQNLNDAISVREEERRRILRGDSPTPAAIVFSKAAVDFLDFHEGQHRDKPATSTRTRTSLASLRAFFGNDPVNGIRSAEVEDFMTWRRKAQIKEITIRHDCHALSLFFQFAQKRGWAAHNPVREVSIPSDQHAQRDYILNPAEEALYFAAARAVSRDLHDLGRLMILQGCRPEELMELPCSRVDLLGGYIQVQQGKSKAARRKLKLVGESLDILRLRARGGRAWVFPSPRVDGQHITKLNNPHNRACENVGIDFVLYDLRHTFATRMAQAGCDIATLAKILGHVNLRSVMRYVHIGQESSDAAMDRYGAGRTVRFSSGQGRQNLAKPDEKKQKRTG